MIYQYTNILVFLTASIFLTYFLIFIGDSTNQIIKDAEKSSSYECGFQPFDIILPNFEIKYYLVALLFLIFDIEIVVLIPFINCIHFMNCAQFFSFFFFYSTLFFALMYE